jgi:hypothetical protein
VCDVKSIHYTACVKVVLITEAGILCKICKKSFKKMSDMTSTYDKLELSEVKGVEHHAEGNEPEIQVVQTGADHAGEDR